MAGTSKRKPVKKSTEHELRAEMFECEMREKDASFELDFDLHKDEEGKNKARLTQKLMFNRRQSIKEELNQRAQDKT